MNQIVAVILLVIITLGIGYYVGNSQIGAGLKADSTTVKTNTSTKLTQDYSN